MIKTKIYFYLLLLTISNVCIATKISTTQSLLSQAIDNARNANNGVLPKQKIKTPQLLTVPQSPEKFDQIPACSLPKTLTQARFISRSRNISDEFHSAHEYQHQLALRQINMQQ